MRILSQPPTPEYGPKKRGRRSAPTPKLGLVERRIKAIADLRDHYENMRVDEWGQLPDPIKEFLQACGMGETERAEQLADRIADDLDNKRLLPEQVPLVVRKAVAMMQ